MVTLEAGKNAKPLILRQRPARRIVIKAFDESGLPMTTARFNAGTLYLSVERFYRGKNTGNLNDVESEPDSGIAGIHQLWVVDSDQEQGLSVGMRPDQAVFWQQTTDGPVAPGAGIVLARKTSEVVAQFLQAGTIHLRVKNGERSIEPGDFSLNVAYAHAAEFAKHGVFSPGFRITQPSAGNEWTIQSIAPGEDVVIEASIKGALLKRRVVQVSIGETKNLMIDLAAADGNVPSVSDPNKNDDGISVPAGKLAPAVERKSPTLTVKYDMPGSDQEARIFVERTGGAEGEIGSQGNGAMKWTPLKNGSSFELKKLMPGEYQVARLREMEIVTEKDPPDAKRAQKITTAAFLDRHRFTLEAGEQMTIDLSRKGGQRVSGTIERADDVKPARMILYVCSANAEGLENLHSLDTIIFDAQQCNDGDFTTDQLEPGEYSLIAVGYGAWQKEAFFRSGEPRAGYIGRIKLTVPRDGQAEKLQVPLYRIHSPAGS